MKARAKVFLIAGVMCRDLDEGKEQRAAEKHNLTLSRISHASLHFKCNKKLGLTIIPSKA